ncbi:hypothetical protein Nepgr_031135 [Nepenthes gracilis]|uniref:Uncharacterized protein n=1 Tax=Nepenthes gracilis TaxID=150966 RepID=A0AAD3Y4I8_NEPGR|nr:hypothetical protein Nepgr_031135 [Nepenthes gracilis]
MGAVSIVSSPPAATVASTLRIPSKFSLSPPFHNPKNLNFSSLIFRNPKSLKKQNSEMSSSIESTAQANACATIGASKEESETTSSSLVGENDLLIIGPGVLGRSIAQKWREEHPGCQIYGQTATADHHDELIQMGINPSIKGTKLGRGFPYVIFCAPPSRSLDYPGDVREAASSWNGEGSLLFTSSSAPYDCSDNGFCDENTAVVPIGRSPRTDILLKAETAVLDCGDRGAHTYWLEKGTVEVRPDHIFNLIHYEDAATLAISILKKNFRRRVFLGCDNHPLSRQEAMDLVNRSGKFRKTFVGFTGTNDPLGKRLNNSITRAEIGWQPKYGSFAQFLETL